jgi:hypothetical protein
MAQVRRQAGEGVKRLYRFDRYDSSFLRDGLWYFYRLPKGVCKAEHVHQDQGTGNERGGEGKAVSPCGGVARLGGAGQHESEPRCMSRTPRPRSRIQGACFWIFLRTLPYNARHHPNPEGAQSMTIANGTPQTMSQAYRGCELTELMVLHAAYRGRKGDNQ